MRSKLPNIFLPLEWCNQVEARKHLKPGCALDNCLKDYHCTFPSCVRLSGDFPPFFERCSRIPLAQFCLLAVLRKGPGTYKGKHKKKMRWTTYLQRCPGKPALNLYPQ